MHYMLCSDIVRNVICTALIPDRSLSCPVHIFSSDICEKWPVSERDLSRVMGVEVIMSVGVRRVEHYSVVWQIKGKKRMSFKSELQRFRMGKDKTFKTV